MSRNAKMRHFYSRDSTDENMVRSSNGESSQLTSIASNLEFTVMQPTIVASSYLEKQVRKSKSNGGNSCFVLQATYNLQKRQRSELNGLT